MAGTWTDPARDDQGAYDPEELLEGYKAPEWLDKILDGGDDA